VPKPRPGSEAIFKDLYRRANTAGDRDRACDTPVARSIRLPRRPRAVDEARLKTVGSLYRALGLSAPEPSPCVMFYTFLFGQSLLFFDENPRNAPSRRRLRPRPDGNYTGNNNGALAAPTMTGS